MMYTYVHFAYVTCLPTSRARRKDLGIQNDFCHPKVNRRRSLDKKRPSPMEYTCSNSSMATIGLGIAFIRDVPFWKFRDKKRPSSMACICSTSSISTIELGNYFETPFENFLIKKSQVQSYLHPLKREDVSVIGLGLTYSVSKSPSLSPSFFVKFLKVQLFFTNFSKSYFWPKNDYVRPRTAQRICWNRPVSSFQTL